MESIALIAGMISSFIFASSNIPMLVKAYQTKDLHSYSVLNLILVNVGNLLYWLYVVTLPPGPIWVLHTFYTIASGILLAMYWRQVGKPTIRISCRFGSLIQKLRSLETTALRFLVGLVGVAGTDRPVAAQCGPIALVKYNETCCDH
jgi:hypothetical protein